MDSLTMLLLPPCSLSLSLSPWRSNHPTPPATFLLPRPGNPRRRPPPITLGHQTRFRPLVGAHLRSNRRNPKPQRTLTLTVAPAPPTISINTGGHRHHLPPSRSASQGHHLVDNQLRVENTKKPFTPPREVHVQVTHSMPPQKIEIFKSIEGWAEQNILVHLKPVEKCWQAQDFLPDPASDGFEEQVKELRERAKEIPDDYFVVLVGDMITEEALPTYQTMLNTLDGVRDETGASLTPWAVWTRAWTAEENRHGDLLHTYLYLSGRVDMRQIQKTIQYLIGSGMDPRTENSPYLGFIYTSFQERATFISHGNTARHAKEHGDVKLAQICGTIASDEKRHETAYTKIVEKLFEIDPDGTVLAFADMMRKKIAMPAHLMYDGRDDHLFDHFSAVAQRLGVYTAKDYADILEFLVGRWKVGDLTGLSGEGRKAQEYVCGLPPRIRRLEERAAGRAKEGPVMPFSWIFDRLVKL